MKQLCKWSTSIVGSVLVLVLAGVGYLTYQQYKDDESLVNDDFGKNS